MDLDLPAIAEAKRQVAVLGIVVPVRYRRHVCTGSALIRNARGGCIVTVCSALIRVVTVDQSVAGRGWNGVVVAILRQSDSRAKGEGSWRTLMK